MHKYANEVIFFIYFYNSRCGIMSRIWFFLFHQNPLITKKVTACQKLELVYKWAAGEGLITIVCHLNAHGPLGWDFPNIGGGPLDSLTLYTWYTKRLLKPTF